MKNVNANKVVGGFKAGIFRRLKKLGLPTALSAQVMSAVRGDAVESGDTVKLSPRIRKYFMEYVHRNGPIVITGRKSLKIFSLAGYEAMRKASSVTAKANTPWAHAAKAALAKSAAK